MPIDLSFSEHQKEVARFARLHACKYYGPAKAIYSQPHLDTPQKKYEAVKHLYEASTKAGVFEYLIPQELGGKAKDLVDLAIIAEEFHAVDPSMSINILSCGLGLMGLFFGGTPAQQQKYLAPFLSRKGAPLGVLMASEPQGNANWLTPSTGKGIRTTAILDGDDYVVNGEKLWPGHSAGWDGQGPDVALVTARTSLDGNPAENITVLIITREDYARSKGSLETVEDVGLIGHRAISQPHIRYNNLRVPRDQILGGGKLSVTELLGVLGRVSVESGTMVAGMAIGVMRAAFDDALAFAKTEARGGVDPIISYQSVSDIFTASKAKIEAARCLNWKACHELGTTKDREIGVLSKIYATEACTDVVIALMRAVGVESYRDTRNFGHYLMDASLMALFDGGNVGVRRRQFQKMLMLPEYDTLTGTGLSSSQLSLDKDVAAQGI